MIRIASRRHLLVLLLIPYACVAAVASFYFSGHHEGIILAYLLTILWICLADRPLEKSDIPSVFFRAIGRIRGADDMMTMESGRIITLTVVLLLIPSLYWSSSSIICDVQNPYSTGRALSNFIISNNFQHARWISVWSHGTLNGAERSAVDDTRSYSGDAITANPYLATNLLSCTYQGRSYLTHEFPTTAQADQEIAKCASLGEPEFVIGGSGAYFIKRLGFSTWNYTPYAVATATTPWKDQETFSMTMILIRNDVYRKLDLPSASS